MKYVDTPLDQYCLFCGSLFLPLVRSAQEGTNLYRSLHDSPGEVLWASRLSKADFILQGLFIINHMRMIHRQHWAGPNWFTLLHLNPWDKHEELSDDNLPRHANPARPTPPASHSNVAHLITLEDICRIQQQ